MRETKRKKGTGPEKKVAAVSETLALSRLLLLQRANFEVLAARFLGVL